MPRKPRIHIAVGNLNVDITMYVPRLPKPDESIIADDTDIGPGGAASNYSVAVSIYGHRVYLIASTSIDPLVSSMLKELEKRGVNTFYVKRVEGPPGIVNVIVIPGGERFIVKYRGVNELLTPNDVPKTLLKKASLIHMASIPPNIAGEIAERALGFGLLISYDPGAYALTMPDRVLKILKYVSILFLNRREAKALAVDIDHLLDHGPQMVVVKKGGAGALIAVHGGVYYKGISRPLKPPVNSTGAGDAFAAFFNSAYLDYHDPGKALQYGLAAGALKVTCRGSQLCWDKQYFNKQLGETSVEKIKNPEEWMIED